MKTIIDDVECTDERSDGAETHVGTSVQPVGGPHGGTGGNQKCLCTVNRNKTSEQTIMIGMANIFQ